MYDTHIQSRATESLRRRRKVVMVVVVVVNYFIAQRENEECLIYLQNNGSLPRGRKIELLNLLLLLLLLLQGTCILYFRFISNSNRSFCRYARIFPSPFFL
jgi:hypothetical protein